jgi:hypothetical protein
LPASITNAATAADITGAGSMPTPPGPVIEAAGLRRPVSATTGLPGLSNAEIAERLVLSRRTVEHHVQDIYVKISAATRAAAAMFAMQHSLLDQSG